MFDALLQVVNADVVNAQDHLELGFVLAVMIPVGPKETMPIPAGKVRIPLGKEGALTLANGIIEAANQLPDPQPTPGDSGIIVANSLQGVDEAVRQEQALRNGK